MSSVLATPLRFQEPAQRSFPHETVRRQRHSDVLQLQVAFQAFEFPYSAVPATAAKIKLHCTAGLLQRAQATFMQSLLLCSHVSPVASAWSKPGSMKKKP
jgi:hypothetical protein